MPAAEKDASAKKIESAEGPQAHLAQMLLISLIGAATIFTFIKPLSTADLSVFMKMGQWMVETGRLFEHEVFAFAVLDTTFINGTWLAQLAFYALYEWGGYELEQFFLGISTAFALGAMALTGYRSTHRWAGATLTVSWAFTLSLQNLALRPQSFSIPLFALTYLLVAHHAHRRFAKGAMVVIFMLWPNLHGAFPAALVLIGGHFFDAFIRSVYHRDWRRFWHDDQARHRFYLFLLALLGSFANAYGPEIYLYVATNSDMPRSRRLDEWLPPTLFSFMGIRLVLSLILLGFFAYRQIRHKRFTVDWGEIALLASFLWLAVGSRRMIIWWGFVSAPIAAKWALAGRAPEVPGKRNWVRGTALFWGILVCLANPWIPREDGSRATAEGFTGFHRELPFEAIESLPQRDAGSAQESPTRVFNKMMWGSYLLWSRFPEYSPFVDARIWIFDDEIWQDYLDLGAAKPHWQQRLDQHKIQWLLLDPISQSALIEAAGRSPHWAIHHEDMRSVVYKRVGPIDPSAGKESK